MPTNNIFANVELTGGQPWAVKIEETWGGDQSYVNNVFYEIDSPTPSSSGLFYRSGTEFKNNIVVGCSPSGTLTGEYSLFYGNGAAAAGSHVVEADPHFTGPGAGDFTLVSGYSPALDAGDPSSLYDDVDGTRNDLGAYGGSYGAW